MIPFVLRKEPDDFQAKVSAPGKTWLESNKTGRPKDLWGPFKGHLADAFDSLCAYTSMYEPVGTVDHFISCDEDRNRAYDWSNYRYSAQWVNSSKQNLLSRDVFDPFDVQLGWFKIILPSLQLVLGDALPAGLKDKAEFVLRRLRLRDDERVIRQRREWYRMYQIGEITLEGLRRKAPLIARAIEDSRGVAVP